MEHRVFLSGIHPAAVGMPNDTEQRTIFKIVGSLRLLIDFDEIGQGIRISHRQNAWTRRLDRNQLTGGEDRIVSGRVNDLFVRGNLFECRESSGEQFFAGSAGKIPKVSSQHSACPARHGIGIPGVFPSRKVGRCLCLHARFSPERYERKHHDSPKIRQTKCHSVCPARCSVSYRPFSFGKSGPP
jgi:hypothetical protein